MKSEAESSLYSIIPLTPQALADWFLFGGVDTPENRQKLTAILSSAPKVKRFVVYDQGRALGRFAVEPTQTGLTSWCPRLLPNLPTAHMLKLMNEAAHWLTQLVHQEKRAFAECMIQHGLPQQQMWQAALLNQGFQVISTKHQWVFEESDAKSAPAWPEPVSHLQLLSTPNPALEAALREFKNRHVSKIYSLTDAENTPSINTHIKLGFRQTETSFSTLYYVP